MINALRLLSFICVGFGGGETRGGRFKHSSEAILTSLHDFSPSSLTGHRMFVMTQLQRDRHDRISQLARLRAPLSFVPCLDSPHETFGAGSPCSQQTA